MKTIGKHIPTHKVAEAKKETFLRELRIPSVGMILENGKKLALHPYEISVGFEGIFPTRNFWESLLYVRHFGRDVRATCTTNVTINSGKNIFQ